ncbi:PREDICTED: uncharacterized protein LOC105316598 [Amphimedon queenslandica]|uniref:Uncharacterized protein n=1 Tax=Amphimedon queenslandica TaxID=400682 RepID=A0A1X7VL71_AMPQE|nr:PREDICTED: uncharacterized protein LOC105316598 [Amphimedon queenslandica]|eukprot:XP_011409923.1 PREDICTED: uncharacterized protein LOC105316598 [Amphimedon queenslandica]
MASNKQEMQKSMQESWVAVEAGEGTGTKEPKSLSHVKSEEEITQMIAEAVTEERKDPIPIIRQEETTKTDISFTAEPEGVTSTATMEQSYLRSFLSTLLSPSFIISHLTVFLIGVLVGRRLM